jgi:hypothetical protein
MGRRKKAGKHRSRTGATSTGDTGAGRSEISGTNTESTGERTGTQAPLTVAHIDRLTPENTVEDTQGAPAQLVHEANAAMLDAPLDPVMGADGAPAPAGPSAEDMAKGYAMLGKAALGVICEATVPNWEVNDIEQSKIADALGAACALWFPDEVPPKYAALIVLAGAIGQVAISRRDPATGAFIPRHKIRTVAEQPKAEPAPDQHAPIN